MYLQFALVALLALGLGGSGLRAPEVPVAPDRVVGQSLVGARTSAPVGASAASEASVEDFDVVVPPVEVGGVAPDVTGPPAADVVVADQPVASGRVASEVVEADDFQTVGVTWPQGADVSDLGVQVRTRADGAWSGWVDLAPAEDAPDPGTTEAARAVRGGTDPVWVGDADAVQVSFAATSQGGPEGLSLALIDSAQAPVSSAATTSGAVTRSSADSTVAIRTAAYTANVIQAATAPRVITRAEWGAPAQVCAPDVASKLVGAVVHHTAGLNAYTTVAQAMQQIRADAAFHINSRGWCDIGYNFIVDKFGNIYEGRANSLTQPVIGVHAGGFNTGTVGVSMLGNYDGPSGGIATTPAMINAVGRIIGLRLSAYNLDAAGSMTYYTGSAANSRYQNQNVTLPRVFGHRDVTTTACPGNYGYAQLPAIRSIAATFGDALRYAQSQSVVKALYQDLLGRAPDPTGLSGWTVALMQGTSQSALVASLTRSDEYIALRVAKAYNEVLLRGPDPEGAAAWLSQIRAGLGTVDDVQRRFYDSQEYFQSAGGTPEGYVRLLYTTVLHRQAADSEVASWVALMDQRERTWVVDSIWFSMEAARVRAGAYYQTFLGRGPDPTGLTGWAQVLLANGEGAVRSGIAGSQEYKARAIVRFP